MAKADTFNRARLEIMNRIFQFSLCHQWGDGRVGGGLGEYAWVSDISTPPQVGDLVTLKSAPTSVFYLSWLEKIEVRDGGWTHYLVRSVEDGSLGWWHNVGIDHFNRKTLAEHPDWRWTDRQFAFKDRWWRVCFNDKDAYITLPVYPEFGEGYSVTIGTRTRHGWDQERPTKKFLDWRKVTKAQMGEFYDECVARKNSLHRS